MTQKISYKYLFSKKLKILEGINTFQNYFEMIKNIYPENILFEYNGSEKTYDSKNFFKKVDSIHAFLEDKFKDFEKNSWVGIKLPNHPLYLAVCFATLKSGFNVVFIDDKISKNSCEKLINESGVLAIITNDAICSDIVLNVDFEQAISSENQKMASAFFADKIALCSSGTEGNIKISVYDGENFFSAVKKSFYGFTLFFSDQVFIDSVNKILVAPPFHHVFGMLVLFIFLTAGITIVINKENKSLSNFLNSIKNNRIQIVAHVPAVLDSLFTFIEGKYKNLTSEILREVYGESFKYFIGAGVGTTQKIIKTLKKSGVEYIDCYGSTETGVISIDKKMCCNLGCKMQVLENNNFFDEGYGELVITGKGIRSAVLEKGIEISKINENKENAVYTGDIVEIAGNSITIKGRKNDIIIRSNGENIIPGEIEETFGFFREFNVEYTVLGINQSPVLVVSLKKDNNTEEYINKLIYKISIKNKELALYKRVISVYFIDMALPLTSTSKVRKDFLKNQLLNGNYKYKKVVLINRPGSEPTLYDIKQDIKIFFGKYLNLDISKVKDESLIIEELDVNSIIIAEIFIHIEEKYKIAVSEEFMIQNSLSINDISNMIYNEIQKL